MRGVLPSSLVDAVIRGDEEKTEKLCSEYGVDINLDIDGFGRNLLHLACICGHLQLVRLFIGMGADVRIKQAKYTPLALAIYNLHYHLVGEFGCDPNDGVSLHMVWKRARGDMSMVKTLVDLGISVNTKDDDGNTLLHKAVKDNNEQAVLALLTDFKCDSNVRNELGRTPLHLACLQGSLSMTKNLIEYGGELGVEDRSGQTPLHYAERKIFSGLVCNRDSQGMTPLHVACGKGILDIVKRLIEYGADMTEKDLNSNAPLHCAVKKRQHYVIRFLLRDFHCDPNIICECGMTSLHLACRDGDLDSVRILIDNGAHVGDKTDSGATPLMLAVSNNHTSIVSALVSEFGCDPSDRVSLHTACEHGKLKMVRTLIKCGASLNDKNIHGNTPLSLAAQHGHDSIVSALLSEFGCDPNDGVSLHTACEHGNLSIVGILADHCANLNDKDGDGNTPLHKSIAKGYDPTILALLRDFKCDPNIKNKQGMTSLHVACGSNCSRSTVELLMKFRSHVNVQDHSGSSPLHLAVKCGNSEVALSLVNVCDQSIQDKKGMTPLHLACRGNHLSIVEILLPMLSDQELNVKDDDQNIPLHYAVKNRNEEISSAFLDKMVVLDHIQHDDIYFLLVAVIRNESDTFFRLLKIYQSFADMDSVHNNEDYETLLMTAVRYNEYEKVRALVSEYGCDVNVPGRGGRSLLHVAATDGSNKILELLINDYGMSPLLVDDEGNTPLHHVCALRGNYGRIHTLLHDFQSSVYVRNKAGETPRDLNHDYDTIFEEYLSEHQKNLEEDYKVMQKLAATKYSGSHCITRVFVVGHPGAGKSSLVEALKREGFIQSFSRVSSKSVALHTAGIVPSIHTSDSYGRVQFYDFAGDPEYYSSHAAILEKLFLSDIGNNICIIVLNLQDEDAKLEKNYLFWSTFLNHNTRSLQHPPSVIVTGSHADLMSKKRLRKKENHIVNLIIGDHVYLPMDCCGPRTKNIKTLRQQIQQLSQGYNPYHLSYQVSILLGLLEKDFSNVTACTAKTIVSHISEVNLLRLPRSFSGLYPILEQLQAIGSLLILGGKEEDCYLVLNVSQLTNEVHKRLFSEEAFSNKPDMASFNIGLLPQSLLQEVLPPYITKECLTQLQYCQEISHVEIGQDYSISTGFEGAEKVMWQSSSFGDISSFSLPDLCKAHNAIAFSSNSCAASLSVPTLEIHAMKSNCNKALLFFPALCKLDRSNVSWLIPPEGSYSIGWLARCTNPHDYFPPRFLHVLLLRVSLRFTLVAPSNPHPSQDTPPDHEPFKRRCKMWKTGVHWLTEEGVECEVDVDISKEVTVSIRSEEQSKEALTVFNSIISCVMEAKAEFCHSTKLKCFLLDKVNCLSEDNLFQIQEVERVLSQGKNKVVSVRGDTWMSSSKLLHARCTFWDSLFPLDEQSVLQYIEDLVDEWFQLGQYLEVPYPTLRAIESDFPNSVRRRKLEMVTTWLSSSHSHPPCWWSLVKALQEMGENASAAAIIRDKGEHVEIQRKLLESEWSIPEDVFLRSLSSVVSFKWPYLAALLSFGSSEIEEVRSEGKGLPQSDHALLMLDKWASKEGATYGQLYQKLKPASVFELCQ